MNGRARQGIVVEPPAGFGRQLRVPGLVQPRQQHRPLACRSEDRIDLHRRLAVTEHGFGHAGALLALPVDLEVLHGAALRRNAAPRR